MRIGFTLKLNPDKIAEYDESHRAVWPEMLALLAQAGFAAHRHYPNMGHNTQRMAFIATRGARG